MTAERFECEKRYQVMLGLAISLREAGIINRGEYCAIEELIRYKYQPIYWAIAT